jgi:hypothetical protein
VTTCATCGGADAACAAEDSWLLIFCPKKAKGGGGVSIVLKELFVGSSSLQVNLFCASGVDQHPIRFNVSVSVSGPIEFEGMVFVLRRQGLAREQKFNQSFLLFQVFAALLEPLHIAVKLA